MADVAAGAKGAGGPGPDGPEAGRGWVRRLFGYCWQYRSDVLLALGASLAGMAVMALVPLVPKLIIDDVIVSHDRSLAPGPPC
ncbi:hypothetical protein SVIO_044550 [Streptomyces violaceusniger]|uniref:Uncharacterized protein n=1 Tax=Streptomyces violaceusniger TaxID=68280 RepID=A0A4D4KYD4_STRVO|nr:hypothetical protein SVIO_044550 [Streptomyces violaceusniger]